jgi:hypothetical protein
MPRKLVDSRDGFLKFIAVHRYFRHAVKKAFTGEK